MSIPAPLRRRGRLPEWADLHPVARLTLEHAADQIGYGEVGGNNAGPFVAALKRIPKWAGDGERPPLLQRSRYWWPGKDLGAWCASGASWCIEEALADYAGGHAPYRFDDMGWSWKRHNAKKLGEMCAAKYGEIPADELPEVGTLMVKHRGRDGAKSGHVALNVAVDADAGTFMTVEFNVGAPPAPVRCLVHSVGEEGLLYHARFAPAV